MNMEFAPLHKNTIGQASSEYLVVLAFALIVLVLVAVDGSTIAELLEAIKKFFKSYSYAISIAPQKLPVP